LAQIRAAGSRHLLGNDEQPDVDGERVVDFKPKLGLIWRKCFWQWADRAPPSIEVLGIQRLARIYVARLCQIERLGVPARRCRNARSSIKIVDNGAQVERREGDLSRAVMAGEHIFDADQIALHS
jgi:hypothetical protein